jgi:hypothetical protein
MDYKRLQNLRNSYPAKTPVEVSAYYENKGNYIRRTGIDKDNAYVDLYTYPIDKLRTLDPKQYPYVDFSFILQFVDEKNGFIEEWTSAPFKKLLEEAKKENNPYFNKHSVAVVPLDYGDLKDHHRKNKFTIGEKYAEVEVTKTISTIEEMILHIQWLTVFTDQFRNTNLGTSINDPIYPIEGIGNWISKHNANGTYGFEWDEYLKQTLNDKVFADETTSDTLIPTKIEKSKPTIGSSLPIQTQPTPLPTIEPKASELPPQQSVYFNTESYQYYPSDVTDNRDVIRFRNGEYNYR